MNNTSDLSGRLKEARQKKGLSQSAAADKLNVSRQAISRWETGKGSPDINSLPLISKLYDISIDKLLGHETSMSESEFPNIKEGMSKSDEASPNTPLSDDNAKAPDSVSSPVNNIFNREYAVLILLLVISSFTTFVGLVISTYIFIWTWRNKRHYKLILVLSVICFLIGLNHLYIFATTSLPIFNNFEGSIEKLS